MGIAGLSYPSPPKAPGGTAGGPFGLSGQFGQNSSLLAKAAAAPGFKPPPPASPPFLGGAYALSGQNGQSVAAKSPGSLGYQSPYDLNTDPALQSADSLAALSDQQAQSSATQQEENLLLSYGDPNLINQYLHDPNMAAAAAGNPNSQIAQLAVQHKTAVNTLDDTLNKANLSYSGYRVTQEQQAENDYQGQLASAAAQVNSGLDTIQGSLAQALAADNASRISAINDAADRAAQEAATTGADPGADIPRDTGTPGPGSPAAKKTLATAAAKAIVPKTGSRAGTGKGERPT